MKIVRLNDKMWFGKYKDHRIIDVLGRDRTYLDRLCDSGLIEYDKKVVDYIQNYRNEKKNSFASSFSYTNTRSIDFDFDQRVERTEPQNLEDTDFLDTPDEDDHINRLETEPETNENENFLNDIR